MKKLPLLITTGIIFFIVGGYLFYEKYVVKNSVELMDLVPADAILVYEKNNCSECFERINKSAVWNIIVAAAYYNKTSDDSLKNKVGVAIKNSQGGLISVHTTKKDDFDLIYYLPVSAIKNLSGLLKNTSVKLSSREFNSVKIDEFKFANQTFSVAIIEDAWVGSFTPFLIEDVIRTYKEGPKSSFKRIVVDAQLLSSVKDDVGNLYVNVRNFSELLSVFSPQINDSNLALSTSCLLDINSTENQVVLNGFSLDTTEHSKYLLSIFRNQTPVPFGLKRLISNRATLLSSFGISDGSSFYNDLRSFVKQRKPYLHDTLTKIASVNKIDLSALYNSISDEFAVCSIESEKGFELSKILLLETSEPDTWLHTFNSISEKISVDTVFFEKYADYEIRELPIYKFSEKLLWPFVSGFKQNFYTSIGNIILVADNLEELKNFLNDIEAEDTWGKSVNQNQFLESTLLESNMSLYINSFRVWNVLSGRLHPRWQQFVIEHQRPLQSLQMASIQFSHLGSSYYTNVLFSFKPLAQKAVSINPLRDRVITNFDRGIYKLHAVKSHVNRTNEILIQDSLNDLSLIATDGKVLWKLSIGDKIISDVSQIDFFKNGKLQYFFATQDAIHIIDRLGNYVDPYPLYIAKVRIEYVSVIDYDNSKKYRFLVADENGKLWMFDKEGNNLDGWKPKDVGGRLSMAPRHHRIKGKDYVIAIRKDGQVYLMNRRGEDLRKFPLDSESIPSGDYFLERGSTISDTYFIIVSRDGFRIKFNIEGKIQSRETLLKNSINSTFSLISEKSNKSYLILQQDGKQFTLADETGRKIISNSFSNIQPADIKYFDFGAGKIFITITDQANRLSYVFDGQGNLLTSPALSTTALEIRPDNSEHFRVFFIHNKSLVIQPL